MHGLVRADGIGEWARALDEVLSGPASQHLADALSDARRVFTERLGQGTWQEEVVRNLHEVLIGVYDGAKPIAQKVTLREWFQIFSELRNKTRGHGALTPASCVALTPYLHKSITVLAERNPIFHLPWAFLHRNLSGRYRVVELSDEKTAFNRLKSAAAATGENLPDGIYLSAGGFRHAELIHTDLNVDDFFVPNGAFRNGTYELHSMITDSRLKGDGTPYLATAGERPPSETEGLTRISHHG